MAQSYVTDAGTLIIPGAYAQYKVQTSNSGLATSGVLMLVGEAEAGPAWSEELDDSGNSVLEDNAFGPDQLANVLAKYKAGPLVDAFRIACAPANDPQITGSFSRAILVKTNTSTKASLALTKVGGGAYGSLKDRSYGALGNLIYATGSTTAEVGAVPTSASFAFIPPVSTATLNVVKAGVNETVSITANMTPAAFQTALDATGLVVATGGAARATPIADGGPTIAIAAPGAKVVVLTYSGASWVTWGGGTGVNRPQVGDTLVIPATNVTLADGGTGDSRKNVGAYIITAVDATTITATKKSDSGKAAPAPAPVVTAITDPGAVGATAVGNVADIIVYSPIAVTFTMGTAVEGVSRSIELADDEAGNDKISRMLFNSAAPHAAVSWLSTPGSPVNTWSTVERQLELRLRRSYDDIDETFSAIGGEVGLYLGYSGSAATATVTITSTKLTTSTAGAVDDLDITLANFPTIADLVAFINSDTDYSASTPTVSSGRMSPTVLDRISGIGIKTINEDYAIGIKYDAKQFADEIASSVLCQLNDPELRADCGMPDISALSAVTYLTSGAKGSTTYQDFNNAIDALEIVNGNFLVPLFSRDATDDMAEGLTESGSTYTIAGIHSAAKTHVIKMSTLKRRKNRQAVLAIDGSFDDAKDAAGNVGSFRCVMAFQGEKNQAADGSMTTFGSWMSAVTAASMQAAAFYRPIFNKGINASGFVQLNGDFDDRNDSNVEDALIAGLIPARRNQQGLWKWASDQTTYGQDSNFVYNSLQAVYVADIIAMTSAQRMESAFVGQSLADISAALGLTYLETIMADFRRLKLIGPSDDAPKGFKNAVIQISGGTMLVSCEVKLAGALYFVPISFTITPIQQTAAL